MESHALEKSSALGEEKVAGTLLGWNGSWDKNQWHTLRVVDPLPLTGPQGGETKRP